MKLASIILAAGSSRRMGESNKLLADIAGRPLCSKVVQEVSLLNLEQNLVVTGHDHERVEEALEPFADSRFEFIYNIEYKKGMHSSIRRGIEKLADCDAFFICLADMPSFSHSTLGPVLIEAQKCFREGHLGQKIIAPVYQGQLGHPVLIGKQYVQEILSEDDGDFGCHYLFKRHPENVLRVDCESSGILKDIDTEEDIVELKNNSQTSDLSFFEACANFKKQNKQFSIATVIDVEGSSSAQIGSKAIFDVEGNNQLGWIGGGCVERFVGDQSIEAIEERSPRSVWADLDDEVFGLGVACGGKVKIFIDPITHLEQVSFPNLREFNREIENLCHLYGIDPKFRKDHRKVPTSKHLLLEIAREISYSRGKSFKSMREVKNPNLSFPREKNINPSRVVIVGQSRITESLAFHFSLLGKNVVIAAPSLKRENYSKAIEFIKLEEGYENIPFQSQDVVIVASHTAQDPSIVARALANEAAHVAMIGSQKRSKEVFNFLEIIDDNDDNDDNVKAPLYVPAGLDLGSQNPAEIALSVVSEVIQKEVSGAE